jgi:hypothetical protein
MEAPADKRVLAVDDNEQNLMLLRMQLRGRGFVLDEARHGAEALLRAQRAAPDVVISDLLMPVMDGFALLRRWRADPRLAAIPFIVYTATYTGAADRQLAHDLGADAFLVKPAEPSELLRTIEHALEAAGRHGSRQPPPPAEEVFQHRYSEVLVTKLERKAEQLEAANRRLGDSERHYRALFEAIADGVLLIDGEHRIVDANPAACRLLGYRRDELMQHRLPELLAESCRLHLRQRIDALLGPPTPSLAEWQHQRKDGSTFPAEVSARPAGDGRCVAVLRDVTERRRAEGELLRYRSELSQLTQRLLAQEQETTRRVAQALHDNLGQSLTVARLHFDATMTTAGAGLPAPAREGFERVGAALDQAIADTRLALAGLRPPHLEDGGLVAALENEIHAGGLAPGRTDVLLEVDDADRRLRWPPEVEYAAFMIAREAVVNALQHADPTLVRVLLGGNPAHLRLQVIDNGCGIAAETVGGRSGHLGLVGMRERALSIGARFEVAGADGGGTRVTLNWSQAG